VLSERGATGWANYRYETRRAWIHRPTLESLAFARSSMLHCSSGHSL